MSSRYPLMEEDGFVLMAQPREYWVSWIDHKDCPGLDPIAGSAPWRWVNIYEGIVRTAHDGSLRGYWEPGSSTTTTTTRWLYASEGRIK